MSEEIQLIPGEAAKFENGNHVGVAFTAGELISLLNGFIENELPASTPILLSRDGEGNAFHPIEEVRAEGLLILVPSHFNEDDLTTGHDIGWLVKELTENGLGEGVSPSLPLRMYSDAEGNRVHKVWGIQTEEDAEGNTVLYFWPD